MPRAAYGLIGIGIFLFAVATGQALPNIDSMLINFSELGQGSQLVYQIAILVIGFGGSLVVMSKA